MFFARSSTSTYWPFGECVSHSSSTSLTPSSTLRTVNSQAPWATASPTRYDSSTSAGCSAVSSRDSSAVSSRSEEHTSELQSRPHLVCRLLLEKKNKTNKSKL